MEYLKWIETHWQDVAKVFAALVAGVIGVMSAFNAAFHHHSLDGVLTKLRWVSEHLSVLTSPGARTRFGKLKAPWQDVPPDPRRPGSGFVEDEIPTAEGSPLDTPPGRSERTTDEWKPGKLLRLLGLIVLTCLSGCASTKPVDALRKARATVVSLHPRGAKFIHERCLAFARRCASGDPVACTDGDNCMADRRKYDAAVIAATDALGTIQQLWAAFAPPQEAK